MNSRRGTPGTGYAATPPGGGGGYGAPPPSQNGYPQQQQNNTTPVYQQQQPTTQHPSSPPASSYQSSAQQEDNSKNKPNRRRMSTDAKIKTKQWVEKNSKNLLLYFGLIVGIIFFYHAMSDGDFSFLLTLGSMIRTFAFGILLLNILSNKSVAGVSLKMVQLYVIVFACRLASILFYEGYLPFDSSGDFLYRAMEIISFLLCIVIAVLCVTMHKDTYDSSADSFGNILMVPSMFGIIWVIFPSLLLALIFHPSLNSNMLTDVSWTFALAMESTAILPQIIMFIKSLKAASASNVQVQAWVSHVLSCLGLARLIHLLFWISSYTELNDKFNSSPGGSHVGHFVVFSQCVQLLLMCDYLYYYVKALYTGEKITESLQNNWASSGRSADEFA